MARARASPKPTKNGGRTCGIHEHNRYTIGVVSAIASKLTTFIPNSFSKYVPMGLFQWRNMLGNAYDRLWLILWLAKIPADSNRSTDQQNPQFSNILPAKSIKIPTRIKWNRAKLPFNFPQLYPQKWGKRPKRPELRPSLAAWDRCSGRRSDAASWDEGLAHLSGPLRAPFARQFQKTGEAPGGGGCRKRPGGDSWNL